MLPLVLAAAALGALLLGVNDGGASSAAGAGPPGETPSDKKAREKASSAAADTKAANEATKVFAGLVTLVGAAISASSPPAAPFVGGAATATAIAWSSLSTQDKARVWRGELK